MNSIKVLFTRQQQQNLLPGRYYIGVRVKIPTLIVITEDEEIPPIQPSLEPQNLPQHSHPNVALAQTLWVIFDISDHPACPTERTVTAADTFLADHYPQLDRALQSYLSAYDDNTNREETELL